MCLFGFLRVGDIVVPSDSRFDSTSHLVFGDLRVNDVITPQYWKIRVKASKTDPFRQGVSVFLGATGRAVRPVASILSYMCRWDMTQVPFSVFPTEMALLGTNLSLRCGQCWTAPDTSLLFTWAIASVSMQLPLRLSVGSRTL